jgi:hypothetical protein
MIALQALWLCRNGSLFLSMPTMLGTRNFAFCDTGGTWEYRLYANNSRGFQAYSAPVKLKILPLKTEIQLKSTLDVEGHAIALEVRLYDELNRSCRNVPLQVTIFDNGRMFYDQGVATGMDGVALIIHFDQFLDHSFTIQIASEATPLYKGALLTAGAFSYEGFPAYWIIEMGGLMGFVGLSFLVIHRRIALKDR